MSPQRRCTLRSTKANTTLCISALDREQLRSNWPAAELYNVNKDTLRKRRLGKPSRQDCVSKSTLLTELEEKMIIEHALDVVRRSFQLNFDLLRSNADNLLADRGGQCVGIK